MIAGSRSSIYYDIFDKNQNKYLMKQDGQRLFRAHVFLLLRIVRGIQQIGLDAESRTIGEAYKNAFQASHSGFLVALLMHERL